MKLSRIWGKLTCIFGEWPNISLQEESCTIKTMQNAQLFNAENERERSSICKIFKDESQNCWVESFSPDCIGIGGQKFSLNEAKQISSGDKLSLYKPDDSNELLSEFVFSQEPTENDKNIKKRARSEDDDERIIEEKRLKFENNLCQELKCNACQKIVHYSTTLIPCLHSYCGLCLMQLFQRTQDCLVCGVKSRNFTKDVFLNNLAEIYLEFNEEAKRSEEEYREIDQKFKKEGLTFAYTSEFESTWEGIWKNGRANGPGKMIAFNGDIYEGNWINDKMNGEGKITYSTGTVYEGEFKNDSKHGKGKLQHPNGGFYEGDWKDGHAHGRGKVIFMSGSIYEGSMKDSRMSGNGEMIYINGDVYEGEWDDKEKHGQGKMVYANGDVYEGRWRFEEMHGKGKMKYSDGNVYEGQWKRNQKNGKGRMRYADGDIYEGMWKNDEMHGKGKMKYKDGKVYIGGWHRHKKEGKGKIIYPNDGGVVRGIWKENKKIKRIKKKLSECKWLGRS